jgi:hypothetical protein
MALYFLLVDRKRFVWGARHFEAEDAELEGVLVGLQKVDDLVSGKSQVDK